MKTKLLLVDDDPAFGELVVTGLGKTFDVSSCASAQDAIDALATEAFAVVVTDLNMRGMNGIELCTRLVESHPDLPVIVITAFGSFESAILAIRAGAHDYITKPVQLEGLAHTVRRAVEQRALRDEVKRLRLQTARDEASREIVGKSDAMRRVLDLCARVAPTDASVLVTGESGTGKELVARALHRGSERREAPFVALNCAAMPEALLESELFGHARGAFTDAKTSHTGLFVSAHGGTVFLDEIGDMPLALQPKLLRALQERTVRPVGGTTEVPFDVRIVAATNKDLDLAVSEGRFREDLFYRLVVVEIALPPLRARGNDVLLLAQRFLEDHARASNRRVLGFCAAVAERLLGYPWPGNVRELANCIERAVALARYEELVVEDLPDRVRSHVRPPPIPGGEDLDEIVTLDELERRYVLRVLDAVDQNRSLAAQLLGVDRKTLYRKLGKYGFGRDA